MTKKWDQDITCQVEAKKATFRKLKIVLKIRPGSLLFFYHTDLSSYTLIPAITLLQKMAGNGRYRRSKWHEFQNGVESITLLVLQSNNCCPWSLSSLTAEPQGHNHMIK